MLVTVLILIILSQMYFNSSRNLRKKVLKKTMLLFLEKMQVNLSTHKFGIKFSDNTRRKWELKILQKENERSLECEFDNLRFMIETPIVSKLTKGFIREYSSGSFSSISFLMYKLDNFIAIAYMTSKKQFFWENLINDFSKSHLNKDITFLINNLEIALCWDKETSMVGLYFFENSYDSNAKSFTILIDRRTGLTQFQKNEIISYLEDKLEEEPFPARRNLEILRVTALSLNKWKEEEVEKYQIPSELQIEVFESLT